MSGLDLFREADRQLTICNACRYCEGYCAVFRAIETRRSFTETDVLYLSNLCHDCRACYYACMYTPPHEFAVNIPQIMSEVRIESYRHWSWPAALAKSFTQTRIGMFLAAFVASAVILASVLLIAPDRLFAAHVGPGAFYQLIPYLAMVIPALVLFFYGIAIWIQGCVRFWSESGAPTGAGDMKALTEAMWSALGLRYLQGGGPGCNYPDDRPSAARRIYHSLTFWGFLFAFASTTSAFFYQDVFHRLPPYALTSVPVVLGSIGGITLIIGTGGLLWLKIRSDRVAQSNRMYSLDHAFLGILGLTAFTGMLTLILRSTRAIGSTLTVHLALVAALFMTAPYGKFVHFLYRSLALIRYELEQKSTHQQNT